MTYVYVNSELKKMIQEQWLQLQVKLAEGD